MPKIRIFAKENLEMIVAKTKKSLLLIPIKVNTTTKQMRMTELDAKKKKKARTIW